ncbi:MAG: GDP-mannose 4,6-dehydratase [Desulfobacteraceae bacterium]|nr:GDP-mannose 4,6-dehydratase [Desulfobacteraceae bacterium]
MKIGITGCAGFLGSHLADHLLDRGYTVIGIDNLSMGKIENIQHNFKHPNFSFFKDDVRNLNSLKCRFKGSDIIVHLAAYKIPRYGNAIDTLLINSEGCYNVLETAKENKSKVLLASTSDVYGKNQNLPFNEEADLLVGTSKVTRWSYAVSKIYGEHLTFAYQEQYKIPVVILRIFGSYGPRQHLSWWGGPQSVFISQILKDQEITIHGDGKQIRTFTYVNDTIDGFVSAVENDETNGQIFNIGSTYEISIMDLAKLMHGLCNTTNHLKLKFVPYSSFYGGRYEDVKRRLPDISKAKRILGFEPKISLERGLTITIKWQKKVMGIDD